MIQVPVARGPSQQGGGPAIIGVLLALMSAWSFFTSVRTPDKLVSILWIAGGIVALSFALQLLTPKR